jgi:hypothetical protein
MSRLRSEWWIVIIPLVIYVLVWGIGLILWEVIE